MDESDPTACFCGCGRSAGFGRARAVNRVAARLLAEGGDPSSPLLAMLRRRVHGDDDDPLALDAELRQAASAGPSWLREEMSSLR